MLPRDVQDIIYDFALGLRMVHLMREVREAYMLRIRRATRAELAASTPLWIDWVEFNERSWSPFENYIDYTRWLRARRWWGGFRYFDGF